MTSSQIDSQNSPVHFENYVRDYKKRPCHFPENSGIFYLGYKLARIAPGSGYLLSVNMTSTLPRTRVLSGRGHRVPCTCVTGRLWFRVADRPEDQTLVCPLYGMLQHEEMLTASRNL